MKLIVFLRTPTAILVALGAALLAQLPHAADVFRLVVVQQPGTAWGWAAVLHSYLYAVALEVAILVFVVNGWNKISYAFAAVSIGANLAYYFLHGVQLFSVAALPVWLISIALPAAIALYSHLLADEAEDAQAEDERTATATATEDAQETPELQSGAETPAPIVAQPTAPAARRPAPAKRKGKKPAPLTTEQRRNQIAEMQLQTAREIRETFSVSERTAYNDLEAVRAGLTQTNGVQP